MPVQSVIVLGAGIAGLAAALALTKHNRLRVQIYELRSGPSPLGGAINLTPNAMRLLDHLGVVRGGALENVGARVPRIEIFSLRDGRPRAQLDFSDVQRFKFTARRVRRADLIAALTAALAREGVEVRYGMRATGIRDEAGRPARVAFADGSAAEADLVLGCDGIHSAVRTLRVDPARAPAYTGIATATGVAPAEQLPGRGADLPFDATSLYSGRRGSVLLSRFEPGSRDDFRSLYVGAVMETPPPADDEDAKAGWRARGADAEALRRDIVARFSGDDVGAEWPRAAVAAVEQWVLFPVYKLPPRGAWWRGRCLLLGDAAHAMPPQGESIGMALEDVVVFSRVLERQNATRDAAHMFQTYDGIRRERIEAAWQEADFRFETVKDKGWLVGVMMDYLTILVLWWTRSKHQDSMAYDVRDLEIPN